MIEAIGLEIMFKTSYHKSEFLSIMSWLYNIMMDKNKLVYKSSEIYLNPTELLSLSCPTLCDPVDCSAPGSSVHEIS